MDFAFEQFDREVLEEGFRRANALVARDLAVRVSFVPAAEARARPELFKLETTFRHDLPELRLVEIEGFDTQADGGCHVARLERDRPARAHQDREQGQGQPPRLLRPGVSDRRRRERGAGPRGGPRDES